MIKIPIPKEHGAWAMLYAPLLSVAALLGISNGRFFLFLLAVTALFFLNEPLIRAMRLYRAGQASQISVSTRRWIAFYFAVAALAAGALILQYKLWKLVFFAGLFLLFVIWHLALIYRRKERKTSSEILAVVSLTSSAPAVYYVLSGTIDHLAIIIWALNILFFASSVFYLKMRVGRFAKKPNAAKLRAECLAFHLMLGIIISVLLAMKWISWPVVLGYFPILFRSIYAMFFTDIRINLVRIGLTETGYTLIFATLLVCNFR